MLACRAGGGRLLTLTRLCLPALLAVLLVATRAQAGPLSGVVSDGARSVRTVHDAGGGATSGGGMVCRYTLGSPVAGSVAAAPQAVTDGLAAYLLGMHDTAPPSAFALITPATGTETTATTITFNWSTTTDSSPPVSYRVIIDTDMAGPYYLDSTVIAQTTLTAALYATETWSWRVIATDARGCSRTAGDSTLLIYALTPPAPLSPVNGTGTTAAIVPLRWSAAVSSGPLLRDYRLQAARNDSTFASPAVDVYHSASTTETTTSYRFLAADTWYWRVQARDVNNLLSAWSAADSFVKTTDDKATDFNLDGTVDSADLSQLGLRFGVPGLYHAAYDIGKNGIDGRIDEEDIFEFGRLYGQ